ncbi:tetraacyldisaccharide 4'-kinase [Nitrospira sp.]|nr:tetraacyldisaccharide 4'-kinase [Nitrospira sp.]
MSGANSAHGEGLGAAPSWQRVLSWPYAAVVRARAWAYRRGYLQTRRLPCRVISVGNLTVGGTGKTPTVIWIVQHLLTQGRRVAVLSRGYRRRSRARHVLVSDGHTMLASPAEAGDEPFLIARRCPRAVVAVGTDRYSVGQWVLERYPVDDIVLDDAFQHLQLERDVNLLLIDASDRTGFSALLPFGRLREPLSAAGRASALVLTRAEAKIDTTSVESELEMAVGHPLETVRLEFVPKALVHIMKGQALAATSLQGRRVVAVSAIGNPRSFAQTLARMGLQVLDHVVFRDHHAYSALDVSAVQRRAHACRAELIVTTEKDACKLAELLDPSDAWWAVRLDPKIWAGQDRLEHLLSPPVLQEAALHRA